VPQKSYTLTDQDSGAYIDNCDIDPEDVGGPAGGYSIRKRRLQGGKSDGVDMIRVDNGRLKFDILPTRGMGIWKAWLRGREIGWRSPVRGPVHPAFVDLGEPSGIAWLDGFDELLVRCGLESNGAPEFDERGHLRYPVHGRIANRPAHRVDIGVDGDTGEIVVAGVVEETRFHLTKLRLTSIVTVKVGEAAIHVRDEVQNISASEAEMQLLYHINFGPPLLEEGSEVVAPVREVVPRNDRAAEDVDRWSAYGPPQAGFEEQVYFTKLATGGDERTLAMLKNRGGDFAAGVRFNTTNLPCFSVWKNTTAEEDGYVTGLEPGTNYPNPRSFEGEQGRTLKLGPGERATFDVRLEVYDGAEQVAAAAAEIEKLRADAEPTIHQKPQPGWCDGT